MVFLFSTKKMCTLEAEDLHRSNKPKWGERDSAMPEMCAKIGAYTGITRCTAALTPT